MVDYLHYIDTMEQDGSIVLIHKILIRVNLNKLGLTLYSENQEASNKDHLQSDPETFI